MNDLPTPMARTEPGSDAVLAEQFVMLADRPDVDTTVEAVKLGAYHVLVKDADPGAVLSIVAHAAERQDLNRQVLALADQVRDQSGDREFVSGPRYGVMCAASSRGVTEQPVIAQCPS